MQQAKASFRSKTSCKGTSFFPCEQRNHDKNSNLLGVHLTYIIIRGQNATARKARRHTWEFTEPGKRQVGPTPDVHAHSQNRRPHSAKVNFL